MTDTIFGPLAGTPDVETAYLRLLQDWLPAMLYVLERQKGLPRHSIIRPPGPSSYIGGLDFDTYEQDLCPMITVVVNPTGGTERNGAGYGQWFEVQVGVSVVSESEDEARLAAGYLGIAASAAITQNGSLGGLATRTEMISAPGTEFIDSDIRRLCLSRAVYQTFVDGLVDPNSGPGTPTPPDSPYYGGKPSTPFSDPPVVSSTPVTLVAEQPE